MALLDATLLKLHTDVVSTVAAQFLVKEGRPRCAVSSTCDADSQVILFSDASYLIDVKRL